MEIYLKKKKKIEELYREEKNTIETQRGKNTVVLTMRVEKTSRGAIIAFEIDFFASERVNFRILEIQI